MKTVLCGLWGFTVCTAPAFGQVEDEPEFGDDFGDALAAGDFDGDGFADLVIGVAPEDLDIQTDAGAVHVLYGGTTSLTDVGAQLWHQDIPGIKDVIGSFESFGDALAVGDFDGDGADDLAIGVRGQLVNGHAGAGSVHVLYGEFGVGLTTDGDEVWTQDSPGIKDEAEGVDFFGGALAAGDFDGDGFADLVVTATGESVGLVVDAGAVHVMFGSAVGLSEAGDALLHQDARTVKEVAEDGDHFGFSLAVGDFDGDGLDDLAVGAQYEDLEPPLDLLDAGVVHVFYGSSVDGLTDVGNELWTQAKIKNPAVTVPVPGSYGSQFGATLAAGDFDGDGLDDLVVAAPTQSEKSTEAMGVVHVLFGEAGAGLTTLDNQVWHQGVTGILDVPNDADNFGTSLAVADFDGDGVDDLAIGVENEYIDVGGNDVTFAGGVHVLSGAAGTGLTAAGNQFWSQESPGIVGNPLGFGFFGYSLVGADFDGDGLDELAISAPGDKVHGIGFAGTVHVLPGEATGGVTSTGAQIWSQDS